jgi:hypothetical protein
VSEHFCPGNTKIGTSQIRQAVSRPLPLSSRFLLLLLLVPALARLALALQRRELRACDRELPRHALRDQPLRLAGQCRRRCWARHGTRQWRSGRRCGGHPRPWGWGARAWARARVGTCGRPNRCNEQQSSRWMSAMPHDKQAFNTSQQNAALIAHYDKDGVRWAPCPLVE